MRVLTGRVADGKIDVGGHVEEGALVAVLAPDDSGFELTVAQEAELSQALQAIQGGESIDGRQLLDEIRGRAGG